MTTPEEFFGTRRDPGPVRFIDAPADNLTVLGVAGPWSQRLPHFRLDSTPSNGDEIQSEYFVHRRHGPAALEALRRRSKSITPLLMISEIRATARDRLWLSGSYGRETMALHFTWRNRPDQVDVVLKDVEEALEPFAARPHWGKVSHVTAGAGGAALPQARRRDQSCSSGSTPTAGSATIAWSAWASARPVQPAFGRGRYQLARARVRVIRSRTRACCGAAAGGPRRARTGTRTRGSAPQHGDQVA